MVNIGKVSVSSFFFLKYEIFQSECSNIQWNQTNTNFHEFRTKSQNHIYFIQGESLTGTHILTVNSWGQKKHFFPLAIFVDSEHKKDIDVLKSHNGFSTVELFSNAKYMLKTSKMSYSAGNLYIKHYNCIKNINSLFQIQLLKSWCEWNFVGH